MAGPQINLDLLRQERVKVTNEVARKFKTDPELEPAVETAVKALRSNLGSFDNFIEVNLAEDPDSGDHFEIKIKVSPLRKMTFDEEMSFWDRLSAAVSASLKGSPLSKRIFVSVEPE